jgi:hypothetical protein
MGPHKLWLGTPGDDALEAVLPFSAVIRESLNHTKILRLWWGEVEGLAKKYGS